MADRREPASPSGRELDRTTAEEGGGLKRTFGAKVRERTRKLRREARALYYAYRDPRVPWYSRAVILLTVAYLLSPLDLIPDFIPVLGFLDDLLIIPLGVFLSFKTIPKEVLEECRKRAEEPIDDPRLRRYGALVVIAIWVVVLAVAGGIVAARVFR